MNNVDMDYEKIGRLMDVSTVRTDVVLSEINQMIDIIKYYNCICASPYAKFYAIHH